MGKDGVTVFRLSIHLQPNAILWCHVPSREDTQVWESRMVRRSIFVHHHSHWPIWRICILPIFKSRSYVPDGDASTSVHGRCSTKVWALPCHFGLPTSHQKTNTKWNNWSSPSWGGGILVHGGGKEIPILHHMIPYGPLALPWHI